MNRPLIASIFLSLLAAIAQAQPGASPEGRWVLSGPATEEAVRKGAVKDPRGFEQWLGMASAYMVAITYEFHGAGGAVRGFRTDKKHSYRLVSREGAISTYASDDDPRDTLQVTVIDRETLAIVPGRMPEMATARWRRGDMSNATSAEVEAAGASWVAAVQAIHPLLAEPTPRERWTDEALLHDGRTIDVERAGRVRHTLRTTNPDTMREVAWSGEQGFSPILLDFRDGVAHLVIYAFDINADLKRYGCPEIPYVFFRQDRGGAWIQLAASDFPRSLLIANLSPGYDPHYMKEGGVRRSAQDIRGQFGPREAGGFLTRTIPTDFASWGYRSKNQYRVGRHRDGCRHTVPSNADPSHPQSGGKPFQKVALEVLETKLYDPEWVIKHGASPSWNDVSFNMEQDAKCQAMIRRVGEDSDRPELRGWLLFAADPSGRNKARQIGGPLLCTADALWFTEYATDRQYVILSKFSRTGDFLYRVGFERPPLEASQQGGAILQRTFRAEDGYLYFEWWNTRQYGGDIRVRRATKTRLEEPRGAR